MGERNEEMAHALVAQLQASGVDACASRDGIHWQVDAGVDTARAVRVRCFWYRAVTESGRPAGPTPSNARALLDTVPRGPEYLVTLRANGAHVADGRTAAAHDVVTCARGWLAGLEVDPLVCEVPFVDAGRRAIPAIAQQLDPQLRWEMHPDPGSALWVSSEDRRCEVRSYGAKVTCSFLLGPQQVAYHPAANDLPDAVASWLIDRISLDQLTARVPGVGLERHAEVLETAPARWHWLHVLDRIADPDNVLAPLHDMILALSSSPIATRFYSYSSLGSFCFSASSHYVWVDRGLPVVVPDEEDGRVLVDDTPCDVQGAVHKIEETLAAYPIRPFFGSAAHHDLPLLAECLVQARSELRPHLVPRGKSTELVVEDRSGERRCSVADGRVAFNAGGGTAFASWPTLELAARAIRRYCEAREPVADIIADPEATNVMPS
jgi:hypothetical protein